MRRLTWSALVCLAVMGCKKTDNGAGVGVATSDMAAPAVVEPKPQGLMPGTTDVPTPLYDHLVFAEIGLPEKSTLSRVGFGACRATCGKTFDLVIETATRPLAAVRKEWEPLVVRWIADEPGLLAAELRGFGNAPFALEARTSHEHGEWRVGSSTAVTQPQLERMIQSARTLKRTEAAKAAFAKDREALEAIANRSASVDVLGKGRKVTIRPDAWAAGDWSRLPDLRGVTYLEVRPGASLDGLHHVAAMRAVETLSLKGDGVTTDAVRPLAKCDSLTSVVLTDTALDDAGFAVFTALPKLDFFHAGSKTRPTRLTAAGLKPLAGRSMNYVGLLNVPLGEEELKLIAGMDPEMLKLSGPTLRDDSLAHFRDLRRLHSLSILDAPVSDAGLQHLSGLKELAQLTLTNCRVRGYGLEALAGLEELESLSLRGCPINDAGMDKLKALPMTSLDVDDSAITDKGLKALADCTALTDLSLKGNRISDAGLVPLASLKKLERLDLSRTDLDGTGLAHLNDLPKLEELVLGDTLVGDAGLEQLKSPSLQRLDLRDTPMTDAGAAKLVRLPKLRDLSVQGSDVSVAATEKVRSDRQWTVTYDAIRPGPAVKPVAPPVPLDKLPVAAPAALVQKHKGKVVVDEKIADKPIVTIDLSKSDVTDEELGHLRGLTMLQSLNLAGCKNVTDTGLPYLADLTKLASLNLDGTAVKGDGLVHLGKLAELTELSLPDSPVSLEQAAPLGKLVGLERLRIHLPLSDAALRFLIAFKQLRSIDLTGRELTSKRLGMLSGMTGLERLELTGDGVTDRGLAHLTKLRNLKHLKLIDTAITDEGLKIVGAMGGLESLDLRGERLTDAGFVHLRNLAELTRLKVERSGLTDRGMGFVSGCTKLIEVELPGADITDKGTAFFGELRELEFLDLSGTRITDEALKNFAGLEELRRFTADGTAVTGRGFQQLTKSKRLASVRLRDGKASDEGISGINQLPGLESLDLDGTAVSDAGVAKLASMPDLKTLSLNRCGTLTDKVAESLKPFPSLGTVSLKVTKVSPAGVAAIRKQEGRTVLAD